MRVQYETAKILSEWASIGDPERTLTLAQAAILMAFSEKTLRRAIHAGMLPAFRRGSTTGYCYRIRRADLLAWRDRGRVVPKGLKAEATPSPETHEAEPDPSKR